MINKKCKKVFLAIGLAILISMNSIPMATKAHSGRTDGSGGHRDNKNVSGLGSYHYHHGYGPHLHTNGCPYEGGGSSSTSAPVDNSAAIEEAKKKEVYDNGYDEGYKHALKGDSKDYNYSGSYSEKYESGYDSGYSKGQTKLEDDKKKAYNLGLEQGQSGAKKDCSYENDILVDSFDDGYDKGYKEYKEKKVKEYSSLGEKDGKEDKEKRNLDKITDDDIKNAYITSYNKEQDIIKEKYIEEGYLRGIIEESSEVENLKKDTHKTWYEEGFSKGEKRLLEVKNLVYEQGYNSEEYNLPEDAKEADKICKIEYQLGVDKKEKEDAQDMAMGVGAIVVAVGGFFGYKKIKKRRK